MNSSKKLKQLPEDEEKTDAWIYTPVPRELVETIDNEVLKHDPLHRWNGKRARFINFYLRLVVAAYLDYPEVLQECEGKIARALIASEKAGT